MGLADGDLPLADVFRPAVALFLRVLSFSLLFFLYEDVSSRRDLGTGRASPEPGFCSSRSSASSPT
jgi:hypothetical protein